ncbi:SRPBCC family protein [Nocardioides zeae]|uniref:SRPBCC family protein n=1 Tax=Nocardioides imazamoxiresistens TaxID=3231893 RepID=A0ABU3Q0J3_9ACTN|nr:SRPBCC family protein [Nocardioides zeae]MDT9595027.1 SRPBCC family protein [Nocardioides zeae]
MRSIHVSVVVARSPEDAYAFARAPENLPRWAAGLASGALTHEDDDIVVDSPMGRVRVRFAPPNAYGVLDHDVTLPSGEVVANPLRVLAHPDGAEVLFTVRQRDLTDDELDRDVAAVRGDLERLRTLLEGGPEQP